MSDNERMSDTPYFEVYSPTVQAQLADLYTAPCPGCGVEWGNLSIGHRAFLDHTQPGVWQCETPDTLGRP